MAGLQVRAFHAPDETRTPDKTKMDVVKMGGTTAARLTLEPGWKWSECIKPVAGTESCQVRHVGVVHSGTIHIAHEDGSAAFRLEDDLLGDEAFVGFEFESPTAEVYAKG